MKINEFNQKPEQLNELALSSFIGDVGSAAIKSIFTGKGLKQQMIQDMFLKDFYEDAITSLDNGIRGGLVTTEVSGDEEEPDAAAATSPAGRTPTVGKTPPATPTANGYSFKTTQQGQAPQAPLKPTSTNVKFNMPGVKPAAGAASTKPQAERDWENRMKQQGLTPDEIERARGPYQARQNRTFKEDATYRRLNKIFESIVNINEQGNQQTIAQFMTSWFNQYMQGVNWKSQEGLVNQMIKDIENTYASDKGKGAIKKLAKTAFALSKSASGLPKGMEDELKNIQAKMKEPAAGGEPQANAQQGSADNAGPQLNIDQIILAVSKLSDEDLADLKKFVDELTANKARARETGTQYMGKAAPNAGPATKPANPLSAPTLNPNKGTVSASGASKPGDITKGGAGLMRESKRLKKRKI